MGKSSRLFLPSGAKKSVLSAQEELIKKRKGYIPLREDGSNLDEWFDQDLGELLARLPRISLQQILKPHLRKK